MALRLFALQLPVRISRRSTAGSSAQLPKRGDVVVFRHPTENADFIKRVIGLPGDTVEVRGGVLILNGKPVTRQALPPFAMPISDNSPCKVVAAERRRSSPTRSAATATASIPAYRETLPGGPSYTVLDQVDNGRGRRFPGRHGARRPRLPDGRQSRRQPRQPLLRRPKAASAWCRSKISSAARR